MIGRPTIPTLLLLIGLFLLTPALLTAQQQPLPNLPENTAVFIDEFETGFRVERSILRSNLNGEETDTLGMYFGNVLSLRHLSDTDEYLVSDNQGSRILRISSDFTRYTPVKLARNLVYSVDYDHQRDRYFYARIGATSSTRGIFYFDGIRGESQQLDNGIARYMAYHPDSNAVYFAINGTGIVKHQMDRDERSVLVPYNSSTTGFHLDKERNELYMVYSDELFRYDLSDPDAEPEQVLFMGFGTQTLLSMSMNSQEQIVYVSALSGFSKNIVYEIPLNDLDSEINFSIPLSNELEQLHYHAGRNELVFSDGGYGAGGFAFLRGYDFETELTRNHSLRDIVDVAVDPSTGTVYGIDRFFIQSSMTVLFKMDIDGTNREILHQFPLEQKEMKLDTLNNRLLIMGRGEQFDQENVWAYDLNAPRDEALTARVTVDAADFPFGRILSFDADFENDIIFLNMIEDGIYACAAGEECQVVLETGERIFGSSLAFNPNNETLYFEDNDRGIAYVKTDGSDEGTYYSSFATKHGLQYNGAMDLLVWSSVPFSGAPSLRYRSPDAGEDVFSEAFFQGREIHGMDFIITNPTTVSTDEAMVTVPNSVSLDQNYPNPFNPVTSIRYRLDAASEVRLSVYDVTGRLLEVLEQGVRSAGEHEVRFDGSGLSSGMYIYRLEGTGFTETRKMLLIK